MKAKKLQAEDLDQVPPLKIVPYRGTEVQSNRGSEVQSLRETEDQSYGATDVTDGSDGSASASRVATLQEAVELALKQPVDKHCMFRFARALKAFEITVDCRLKPEEFEGALRIWWLKASKSLPEGATFDEYLWCLKKDYLDAKTPLGANTLLEALNAAPPMSYSPKPSDRMKRLKWVLKYLQDSAEDDSFFISFRGAAKVIQSPNVSLAQSMIGALLFDGEMEITKRGKQGGKRAHRYKLTEKFKL